MGEKSATAASVTSKLGYEAFLDRNRRWYNNYRLIALNAWILLFLITSATNGYDGGMMNGLQLLDQWESSFNHPHGSTLGLLSAIQNIGSLAAYPFSPFITDGLGRRPAVLLGAVIMCIATALQTASNTAAMFTGARFLIGFGLTFAANAAPLIVSEISYPPYRVALTSCYNSFWYLGSIIAAWSTYGSFHIPSSWAWRLPSALQGLPSVIQLSLLFFAPESPRWLLAKGRDKQALKTLAYYHADGNEEDPLVQHEFNEMKNALELEQNIASSVGWKSLVATPGNRKRMSIIIALAFFSQWSGNGLVSYYLNEVFKTIGITSATTQLLINGSLQIWNLIIALGASFCAERFGRRILFISSCAGMLLFFSLQTICSAIYAKNGNNNAANAVIAFIFLFYAAYDLAFTPLIVSYTVEILPFSIRAKGFNLFSLTVSFALIFNQYINPIALDHLAWKYYIFYCFWLLFELVFCWFFIVETKNKTLEETAALFDGNELNKGNFAFDGDESLGDENSDKKSSQSSI